VALEGIDGSGKTTQARRLAAALGARFTFEPGDTALGAALRPLVLDPGGPERGPRAEALLLLADRAQHADEVLRPALAAGRWVVTDRYSASTLAYQGHGRGLDPGALAPVVAWAEGGLVPDLSVLLRVPVDQARARLSAAAPDRLEGLDEDFHRRVAQGFEALAAAEPARWAVVEGTGAPDEVADRVARAVAERLGRPGGTGP
jgi:dTMP kinase